VAAVWAVHNTVCGRMLHGTARKPLSHTHMFCSCWMLIHI